MVGTLFAVWLASEVISNRERGVKFRLAPIIIATSALWSAQSSQAITVVTTSAYSVYSSITAADVVGAVITSGDAVGNEGAPDFNLTTNVASLDADVDLGILALVRAGLALNTGILSSTATANVNPLSPGSSTAGTARSTVDDLGVSLFTQLTNLLTGDPVGPPITTVGIGADVITSESYVAQVGTIAQVSGRSVFSNLELSVLSLLNFSLGANAEVLPNFVLLDALGLRLTLNEQLVVGNGTESAAITTNAIHAIFDDYLLGGRLISGDLIIGHSRAEIVIDPNITPPIPEPAVWLQMIAGFGLVGAVVRRRREGGLHTA